jgi:hypothetical protein
MRGIDVLLAVSGPGGMRLHADVTSR